MPQIASTIVGPPGIDLDDSFLDSTRGKAFGQAINIDFTPSGFYSLLVLAIWSVNTTAAVGERTVLLQLSPQGYRNIDLRPTDVLPASSGLFFQAGTDLDTIAATTKPNGVSIMRMPSILLPPNSQITLQVTDFGGDSVNGVTYFYNRYSWTQSPRDRLLDRRAATPLFV